MKFFEKIGKLLVANIAYTVALVLALILFLYFTNGDFIAGALTVFSALVVFVCVLKLYVEYKKMSKPAAKAPVKKPVAKKAAPKKKSKK